MSESNQTRPKGNLSTCLDNVQANRSDDELDQDGHRTDFIKSDKEKVPSNKDDTDTESISEHVPSNLDYSDSCGVSDLNRARDVDSSQRIQNDSLANPHVENKKTSVNVDLSECPSSSINISGIEDMQHISKESPLNILVVSSDENAHDTDSHFETKSDRNCEQKVLDKDSKSEKYLDSLNHLSLQGDDYANVKEDDSENIKYDSSGSEEIIKLDIRGQAAPKFTFPTAKIIFGPPPEDSTLIKEAENMTAFPNLLSPFLVGAGNSVDIEEILEVKPDNEENSTTPNIDKLDQNDLLVEELIINDTKQSVDDELSANDNAFDEINAKPCNQEEIEPGSFSTMTTDYKTICDEYHSKLLRLEGVISQRDEIIKDLSISLQRSCKEIDHLKCQNDHLANEVQSLQHRIGEQPYSEHDTIKGHLSDFVKYESMLQSDDSNLNPAVLSSGSSVHSSNGEKDIDREEITVNYSKLDLNSGAESEEFSLGFKDKITKILNDYEECIAEDIRNKLRETFLLLLYNETSRVKLNCDTEIKRLQIEKNQETQAQSFEITRLRELLASVKAGNAEINVFRNELTNIHKIEMENLRTYFERKCSEMEKSYSEEVWRGRSAVAVASPLGSTSSLEALENLEQPAGAGDYIYQRSRSADLFKYEVGPPNVDLKKVQKKYKQQIDILKSEHLSYINELQTNFNEELASLKEQVSQLKAHIQTAENTESNVSVYQQDIDLELEKDDSNDQLLQKVRQEVVEELQEQIQVLLADPDAEVSNWPPELVALRDKMSTDATETIRQMKMQHQEELSSLRAELGGNGVELIDGPEKWRQRRNHTFDQNRQLEEITKERDGLRRVACTLQRVVTQLVAYCVAAEDELNRTVLAEFIAHLVPHADVDLEADSRATSPNLSVTELNSTGASRSAGRRVHFAPELSVPADLNEDDFLAHLQQQTDLSLEIKHDLELSLRRLRQEAHQILQLSTRVKAPPVQPGEQDESKILEQSQVGITELVQEFESRQKLCENCDLHRKHCEEAVEECLQREVLLRSQLEAAMLKIVQLMTHDEHMHSAEIIAEGYGTAPQPPRPPVSLPTRASPTTPPALDSRSVSLDGSNCGRRTTEIIRLTNELDAVARERDDLILQLEAANRQLRSTRAFIEEQTAERETEHDEATRQLHETREENARLTQRLAQNARILNEVEQLETQTKDMNQIINELENKKYQTDQELKATAEKVIILRDVIANLEGVLEQKTAHEAEILAQLENMRKTIDDRDAKMRSLLGELESLRNVKADQSDILCSKCSRPQDEMNMYAELMEKVKQQAHWLEKSIHRRTRKLERIHEAVCSNSLSEPSEDVSLKDHRTFSPEGKLDGNINEEHNEKLPEMICIWDSLDSLNRAEDAAIKRIADLEMQRLQLKDVAQEVRAERDVLQQRMSEQALRISSLQARLDQQRNNAEALCHETTSHLSVQLHDAKAEVQRLTEELESKDKQLARLRQSKEDKNNLNDQHDSLFDTTCNPKDKVIILERELSLAHSRNAKLESLVKSLEADKDTMQYLIRDHQRILAERDTQLQELLALKLDEDNQEDLKDDNIEAAKTSARTLSDIVSISDFDEQDVQMRRGHLKQHISGEIIAPHENRDRSLNRTVPPDINEKPNVSSLNIDYSLDHLDLVQCTPRADSLPNYLTSTRNKDVDPKLFKRSVNETTIFGSKNKDSTADRIQDNCSMFPNRDVSDKNVTVEPKRIDFSLEPSNPDNRSVHEEYDFPSLRELGIEIDINQRNFPDILTRLKFEIKKSRIELHNCESKLKHAEEQLCEFPALKEEVEALKTLLENTMATMKSDKKFYDNQLTTMNEQAANKKLLEQRITELTEDVNEKSKDLHILKEDILKRENMVIELAKEKRNLTNKMAELEVKMDELQSRNVLLEKHESENVQLRQKTIELQKLEQLLSEKNQQIDSLNQHLDRLDNVQRGLTDKNDELERLKEAFEEKSNELFQAQDTVEALNRDLTNITQENSKFTIENRELKEELMKLEKDNENASIKFENEMERVNSLNSELSLKLEDMKTLTDKLKDKEFEIEILNEDINSFHEEIATLKEQLKIVSRSPSPRDISKNVEERNKAVNRQTSNDKKQLVKIRKQISLLQHELDFNKKELNDKAFELAKAKLDVTELRNNISQATKDVCDKELSNDKLTEENRALKSELDQLSNERQQLSERLASVIGRLREEGEFSEIKYKLQKKTEECKELEKQLQSTKEKLLKLRESRSGHLSTLPSEDVPEHAVVLSGRARSPTAELENAVRAQLNYSHALDESIVEQILSASSTGRSDSDDEDIPPLALHTSKSSSSIYSTSSEKINRLKSENEKLLLQVKNLEARIKDKDALIGELNRIRDKLVQDWQAAKLRYETERDTSGRLQLLLDTQKETAESVQYQDLNMIQILKKRLESAMQSELELQQGLQKEKSRCHQLERKLLELGSGSGDASIALRHQLEHEMETNERLKGEISLLKSKLECEKTRFVDLQGLVDQNKLHFQREIESRNEQCMSLRQELAEMRRLKHEIGIELLHAKEQMHTQNNTISQMERRMANSTSSTHRPLEDALSEFHGHKVELAREITALKKSLEDANHRSYQPSSDLVLQLKEEKATLQERVRKLEKQILVIKGSTNMATADEKDQAVRYLHGRCLRLESCRKALVWQKRYLQRVLSGYEHLEKTLRLPPSSSVQPSVGLKRFKCVAIMVTIIFRMGFLVRRRQQIRSVSASCLFRIPASNPAQQTQHQYLSNSPPSRERASPAAHMSSATNVFNTSLYNTPPVFGPGRPYLSANKENLPQPRNLRRPDLALYIRSPHTDGSRSCEPVESVYGCSTPIQAAGSSLAANDSASIHREPIETASMFLHKLDRVSRRLQQTLNSPSELP